MRKNLQTIIILLGFLFISATTATIQTVIAKPAIPTTVTVIEETAGYDMEKAIKNYVRMGFVVIGTFSNELGNGSVIMAKY